VLTGAQFRHCDACYSSCVKVRVEICCTGTQVLLQNLPDMIETQDQPHGSQHVIKNYEHVPKHSQALTSILLVHPRCLSSYPAVSAETRAESEMHVSCSWLKRDF
jgi:hypothetical protein